jgi:alkaline phosphatase D
VLLIALLTAAAILPACHGAHLTHGVAVGEVSATTAVVWGRCSRDATLYVASGDHLDDRVEVGVATDFTGRIALHGLEPGKSHTFSAWCAVGDPLTDGSDSAGQGAFRTAPDPSRPQPLRFAFGGDVGGQNVCRDEPRGYPIFDLIAAQRPDFFVGLGDMIYADDPCRHEGRYGSNPQVVGPPPATNLEGFRAHWRYNRADEHTRRVLRTTPYYAVWDDHETANDAGPHDDLTALAPGTHLLPLALQAFLDYQPLIPPRDDPTRLYRSVRWGKHAELFLLDTRQYRAANTAADGDAAPKSMLGAAQLMWLERALRASDATWKILVASVPLSIPTGSAARDGFASGDSTGGFEHEAARIFEVLRQAGIRNHLWITTDVHFATGFVYRPFADDPTWLSHEVICGPLNAGIYPNLAVDPTFRPERLFLYAPPAPASIASIEEAIGWFNFGLIDIAADGTLTAAIIDGRGRRVWEQRFVPAG